MLLLCIFLYFSKLHKSIIIITYEVRLHGLEMLKSTFTRSYSILFLDTLTHARIRWIIFPWVITRSRIVMFKALWNNIQTRLLRRNIIHPLPTFHLHTALCYLHSGFVGNLHARQRRRESLLWGYALMQLFPICLQRTNGCDDGERGLA